MRYLVLITFIVSYINSFSQVTANINAYNDVSCNASCNGDATVSATGGTLPYTYSWNTAPVQTTQTATNLCPGTYQVIVTDSLGATDSTSVTIIQTMTLNVSLTPLADDTCGTCTGAATVAISGGIPPYNIFWTPSGDTTQTVTGLCAGYQDVLVFDSGVCFGQDSATVNLVVTPACPQLQLGIINGTVYNDLNANCVQDTLENGLANVMLTANPGAYTASTDPNGNYSFNLPFGSYTITQVSQTYYNEICPVSGSHAVLLDSNNNVQNNIDFADSISSVQDVSIQLLANAPVPGFVASIYLSYTSFNATPMNGTIYLVVDDSLSYVSSTVTPSLISGDTVFWNYSNLQQFETRYIVTDFQTPPNVNLLGDTMSACAHISPTTGDVNVTNNTSCDNQIVVGAFDPNDKRVEPAGTGQNGNILLSQNELTYRIRFQNTGTLFATNIIVVDTLSDKLDFSSLRDVAASHPFTYNVNSLGVLTFDFSNIMLPDSNTNEPGSHGVIQFSIDQNSANSIGTVITNKAEIYFDFNPAIVTNTTINTIVAVTDVSENTHAEQTATIYPNPTSAQLTFDVEFSVNKIAILDLTGKIVKSVIPKTNTINVADLESGIYFIQLSGADNTITQKMVKK